MRTITLLLTGLLLAGCGINLVKRTVPLNGQSEATRRVDIHDCLRWSKQQGARMPQAADVALTTGVLNAIVGAAAGAAVGAAVGHAGEGAKIGTAYAGTVGFANGLAATTLLGPGENPLWISQFEWGQRFYRACVTARGYAVANE